MSRARNLARLIPDTSGLLPDTNLAALSSSKIVGKLLPVNAVPGSPIQVVQTIKSDTYATTSTGYVDVPGLSVSITPMYSTSRILVLGQIALGMSTTAAYTVFGRLIRNGTAIDIADTSASNRDRGTFSWQSGGIEGPMMQPIMYMDVPSTTAALTYTIQIKAENPQTAYINRGVEADGDSGITPRVASSIIVMEIAG